MHCSNSIPRTTATSKEYADASKETDPRKRK